MYFPLPLDSHQKFVNGESRYFQGQANKKQPGLNRGCFYIILRKRLIDRHCLCIFI